jgi:hypothetical protein
MFSTLHALIAGCVKRDTGVTRCVGAVIFRVWDMSCKSSTPAPTHHFLEHDPLDSILLEQTPRFT